MRRQTSFWFVFTITLLMTATAGPAQDDGFLALPAVGISVSQAGQSPASLSFRVVRAENATFVTLLADSSFDYTTYELDAPHRYVVDMPGLAVSAEQVQSVEVESRAVQVVRLLEGNQGSGPARLVVELKQAAACSAHFNADGTGILIKVDETNGEVGAAAADSVLPSLLPPVDMIAWLTGERLLAAVSAERSDYGIPLLPGKAPEAAFLAPTVPRQEAALLPLLPEPPLRVDESAVPGPATVENPVAIALAPAVPEATEVPEAGVETILAPAVSALVLPEAVPEEPAPLTAAAALPPLLTQQPPEAEVALSHEKTTWAAALPAVGEPPVSLATVPSPPASGAIIKVPLNDGSSRSVLSPTAPGTVSVDFVDTPLSDVFKSFAFQTGKDILVHYAVTGTVTLQLHDMLLESAIDLIASMYNLTVKRVDNAYLV